MKKRKLMYRLYNPDYKNKRVMKFGEGEYTVYKNFEQCYTIKKARKLAEKMGVGTELEKIFLTGKHAGKCKVFVYSNIKYKNH